MPAVSRKVTLLQILIAACEKVIPELEPEDGSPDSDFVADLEAVAHRARNELAALKGFPQQPT
jgi:hypothetical protein